MLWRSVLAPVFLLGLVTATSAEQGKITAGSLSENLNTEERLAFLAGVIEGLASARFYADDKETGGMNCIYDWFYDGDDTQAKILEAFDRFPDALPGHVMTVLVRRECGGK